MGTLQTLDWIAIGVYFSILRILYPCKLSLYFIG
jgi:hypothetical protein